MTVAPDGSPVEVYRRLPEGDAASLVHSAIPAHSTILDLGCGVGRIARGLSRLGHRVTGVDNEPAMLRELPSDVEGVLGDVESVRLQRTFDVVLLASHFLNAVEEVPALLATARAHLPAGGTLVAEVYPPGFDWSHSVGKPRRMGDVEIDLVHASVDGQLVTAEMRYAVDDLEWRQPFVARLRDEETLRHELDGASFEWGGWIDEQKGWFRAARR
jgi:SAM-dependent methyltransferase